MARSKIAIFAAPVIFSTARGADEFIDIPLPPYDSEEDGGGASRNMAGRCGNYDDNRSRRSSARSDSVSVI